MIRGLAVLFLMVLAVAAAASCTLAAGECHTMSDCDDGTTCTLGRCSGGADPAPLEALSSSADASSLPKADASAVTDAAPIDAAKSDAGQTSDAGDGSVTDAAPDN
jgi:hypothetical protein